MLTLLVYQYTAHQNYSVLKNSIGAGIIVLSAYCYTPNTKTIKKLFSTLDFDELVKKYPAIKSISADGRYLAFGVTPCWGCGGGHPKTFLYDVINNKGKDIDRVFEFQWLDSGDYQYKEYIDIKCDNPFGCYEDPNKLRLIKESL